MTASDQTADGQFRHLAVFYQTSQDYLDQVGGFIHEGLTAGEPVLVAVPAPRLRLLQESLNGTPGAVSFTDMTELGGNPARIIPAIRQFTDAHHGRTRFVGEPIWPGRSQAETTEATRHEALINAACAGVATTILCPYDQEGLDKQVIAEAHQTHPLIHAPGKTWHSEAYSGISLARQIAGQPPTPVPADAAALTYQQADLAQVRRFTRDHAGRAGLAGQALDDLIIAVNELASNTILHAGGAGTLRIWTAHPQLVCEISDTGRITDPLAGRHPSSPGQSGGDGLRVVHQLCDFAETRSGDFGTSTRIYTTLS